jgi:hypothetical protein
VEPAHLYSKALRYLTYPSSTTTMFLGANILFHFLLGLVQVYGLMRGEVLGAIGKAGGVGGLPESPLERLRRISLAAERWRKTGYAPPRVDRPRKGRARDFRRFWSYARNRRMPWGTGRGRPTKHPELSAEQRQKLHNHQAYMKQREAGITSMPIRVSDRVAAAFRARARSEGKPLGVLLEELLGVVPGAPPPPVAPEASPSSG